MAKLIEWLAALAVPAGAGLIALAKVIFNSVAWVAENVTPVVGLVGNLLRTAADVLKKSRDQVAGDVVKLLTGGLSRLSLLIGLVAKALAGVDIPMEVGCLIGTLRKKIQGFLVAAVKKLMGAKKDELEKGCKACKKKKEMAKADMKQPKKRSFCPAIGECFRRGTATRDGDGEGETPVEGRRLGDRVLTLGNAEHRSAPDREGMRLYRLVLDHGGGNGVDVGLLREAGWAGAFEGGVVRLEMPEMGAIGWARVEAVDECPDLEVGPGCLVTGTFRHRSGLALDLHVEGEGAAIGVTARHPFWSVDREDWVPAGELKVGEMLLAADGSTPRVLAVGEPGEPGATLATPPPNPLPETPETERGLGGGVGRPPPDGFATPRLRRVGPARQAR